MTDIILHDIDPLLLDRIKRIAAGRNWPLQEALMHLLEHGLASGVWMHFYLHNIEATVPHASASGLGDVLADRDERLGVGCAKRAGERLDSLCGWLLAAHDDGDFAVLVAVEPA